jgi:prefoldin subunit 4
MLEVAATTIDEETSQLEDKISSVREEMQLLKVDLYARFGKQINLEV